MNVFSLVLLLCLAFMAHNSVVALDSTDPNSSTTPSSSSTSVQAPVCAAIQAGSTWTTTCDNDQIDEECTGRCKSLRADYFSFIMTCETDGTWMTRSNGVATVINSTTAETFCIVTAPAPPAGEKNKGVLVSFVLASELTLAAEVDFKLRLTADILRKLNNNTDSLQMNNQLLDFQSLGVELQEVTADQILITIDRLDVTVILTAPDEETSELMYAAFNEVWDDPNSDIYVLAYVAEGTVIEQLVIAQCDDGSFQNPCPAPSFLSSSSDSPIVFIIIGILAGMAAIGGGYFAYTKCQNKDKKFEDLELNPSALLSTGSTPLPVPQFEMGGYEFHSAGIEDGDNKEGGDDFDDNRIQITIG